MFASNQLDITAVVWTGRMRSELSGRHSNSARVSKTEQHTKDRIGSKSLVHRIGGDDRPIPDRRQRHKDDKTQCDPG